MDKSNTDIYKMEFFTGGSYSFIGSDEITQL